MIGFNSTSEVSENYQDPPIRWFSVLIIPIRANTTTELDHMVEVTYVDGVGNATVATYGKTGTDAVFHGFTYIFPTEVYIEVNILNDHIAEFNEFFRLNITSITSNEGSPATCQAGDAEQYRCYHDIFILDDDCES